MLPKPAFGNWGSTKNIDFLLIVSSFSKMDTSYLFSETVIFLANLTPLFSIK
jgi:hypothetical protein